MATVDEVRAIASALPRAQEVLVHDRVKWRVGRIVFAALSRDETILGFGFPKEEREALVSAAPERFQLPRPSDMRFRWVEARLAMLDAEELRELLIEAWRLCVPQKISALVP